MMNLPSSSQDDIMNDPNIMLAIAMALKDKQHSSSEGEEQCAPELPNAELSAISKVSDPIIEINPINDLIDKLEFKKTLTVQELSVLTTCIRTQFSDNLDTNAQRTKEFLTLMYYSILNAQSLTISSNFIEMSQYSKFSKEVLNLLKYCLIILQQKDAESSLFNYWLPSIIKLLVCMSSKSGFNSHYSRYLKQSQISINQYPLHSLNQYLSENAPALYQTQMPPKKQASETVTIPMFVMNEEDSIDKILEYVPADYQTLSNLLKDNGANAMNKSKIEEEDEVNQEMEEEKQQDIFQQWKDYIHQIDILDIYNKSLDSLTYILSSNSGISEIETSLVVKVFRSIEVLGVKQKHLPQFLSQELESKAIKVTSHIIKHTGDKDKMEIEEGDVFNTQTLMKDIDYLACSCEILQSVYCNVDKSKLKQKIQKTFEGIITSSNNFQFLLHIQQNILNSLLPIDKIDLQRNIISLIKTITAHIYSQVNESDPKKSKDKAMSIYLTTISTFWCFAANIDKAPINEEVKSEKPQEDQKSSVSSQPSVRTRQQAKKEQTGSKSEGKKNVFSISAKRDEAKKGKQMKKKDLKQLENPSKYSNDEIFKNCISCFVVMLPRYLKQELTTKVVNDALFKNMINLSLSSPSHIKAFTQGILSQFVNPSINYGADAQDLIVNTFLSEIDQVVQCKILTEFLIKISILFKRSDLILKTVSVIVEQIMIQSDKKQNIDVQFKTYSDCFGGKQMNKYMCYVSLIVNADSNIKQLIIKEITNKMNYESATLNQNIGLLHLIQVALLNDNNLKKIKPFVVQFTTKGYNDNAQIEILFKSDLDKAISGLFNNANNEILYDINILSNFYGELSITKIIQRIRTELVEIKNLEQKSTIFAILKMCLQINKEIASINPHLSSILSLGDVSMKQFQDSVDTYLENKIDQQTILILGSKIDRDIQNLCKTISTKFSTSKQFSEDDIQVVDVLFKVLKMLSTKVKSMTHQCIQQHLDANVFKHNSIEFIQLIDQSLSLDIQLQQIITKVQSYFQSQKPEDKVFLSMIIDQQQRSRMLATTVTTSTEDSLFYHCLLNIPNSEYQHFTSMFLLHKLLFNQLSQLIILVPYIIDDERLIIRASELLTQRYDHKYLEHPDGSLHMEQELNNKLIKRATNDKLQSKEFNWIRYLDKSLGFLFKASQFLSQNLPSESEEVQLINLIAKDISMQMHGFSQVKVVKEVQALTSYFQMSTEQNMQEVGKMMSAVFQMSTPQLAMNFWQLAANNVFFTEIELSSSSTQKKGGMALTISFSDKGPGKKGKKTEYKEDVEMEDISEKDKVKVKRNQVAEKFILFLIELLQKNESLAVSYKPIVDEIRVQLMKVGNFNEIILYCLRNSQIMIMTFRKLLRNLIDNCGDIPIVDFLEKQLSRVLRSGELSDDMVVECVKIAQVIMETTQSMVQFIRNHVIHIEFSNQSTRYLLIDFMFQLSSNLFTSDSKYSEKVIKERRQKNNEERLQIQEQKQEQKKQEQNDMIQKKEQQNKVETIDGYKKEIFKKEEQYLEYMEKPDEVCTFTKTKKDFSTQHWYFCYTCNLVNSNGCCAVCARKCHQGHNVVYSRKSNFFCDCGEGGKCQSLAGSEDPKQAKWSFGINKPDNGSLFSSILQNQDPFQSIGLSNQLPFRGGRGSKGSRGQRAMQMQHIYRQGLKYDIGFPPPSESMLSDSSDDDIQLNQYDYIDGKDDLNFAQLKNMRGIMKLIKDTKERMEGSRAVYQEKDNIDVISEHSQMEIIDPIEDPMSDVETVINLNTYEAERKDSLSLIIEDNSAIKTLVQQEKSLIDRFIKETILFLDQFTQQEESADNYSEVGSPSKKSLSLLNKKQCTFTLEHAVQKKVMKEETFKVKLGEGSEEQGVCIENINLLNQMETNSDGLVAICENLEVNLYCSTLFFEDSAIVGYDPTQEKYKFEQKEPTKKIVESMKLSYKPLSLKFNPSNQNFLAVAGIKDLEVFTLSKNGKVVSKLVVDLVLEALGEDLSIVNINWLPDSQTMLAVATREFVRIYDLSEDNISPKFNIEIHDNSITDFTFSKSRVNQFNIQTILTSVIVSTENGVVYHEEIAYSATGTASTEKENMMNIEQDNSQREFTSAIKFNAALNLNLAIPCYSVFYSNLTDMLVITFEGSKTVFVKFDPNNLDKELSGFEMQSIEDKTSTGNLKQIYSKNGENLCNFKDLKFAQNNQKFTWIISAISRKNGQLQGMPVLLKVTENFIDVQLLKQGTVSANIQQYHPCNGIVYVKSSLKESKNSRMIALYDDGSATAFIVSQLQQGNNSSESLSQKQVRLTAINLSKSDLPKEVVMPVNFFEKMLNGLQDEVKSKLQVTGDIVTYFKGKSVLDTLSKLNVNSAQIIEPVKKSIRMHLKLDGSEYVITGLRVKMDCTCKTSAQTSIKIFNRVVKMNQKQILFCDIPFCDVEVLFGAFNTVEVEFLTEDVKNAPIRICSVEIFAQSKKEFNFKGKVKELDKLIQVAGASKDKQSVKLTNEQLIQKEREKSSGMQLLTWEEKNSLYRENSKSMQEGELSLIVDILHSIFQSGEESQYQQQIVTIYEKLRSIHKQTVFGSNTNMYKKQTIKRGLKAVMEYLYEQSNHSVEYSYREMNYNYSIQSFNQQIDESTIDFTQLRQFIKQFNSIYHKEPYYFMKMIHNKPDLIHIICSHYLRLFVQDENISRDISNIVSLIIVNYIYQLNQVTKQSYNTSLANIYQIIYADKSLSSSLSIIQPFLLHQNEQIQKITVSKVLNLQKKYAKAMVKIITGNMIPQNKTENEVMMLADFTPHMLNYLLLDLISQQQRPLDVAYSLSYKLIQQYVMIYTQLQFKDIDVIQHVVNPISQFIQTLPLSGVQKVLYDQNEVNIASYVYANIAFVNLIMQQQSSDSNVKIKISNLGLPKDIQQKICSQISQEAADNIIKWVIDLCNQFEQGFKDGKCTFRTKIEDGIAIDTYEERNGSKPGIGAHLLRPQSLASVWKWHPLFTSINGIFDLLDRKIPSQLMLLVTFLVSSLPGKKKILINTICSLTQQKPASVFLKEIGSQAVKEVLMKKLKKGLDSISDEQQQKLEMKLQYLKAFVKFKQVFLDLEILYNKFIAKGAQLSFNMQFHLHKVIEQTWKYVQDSPNNWKTYIQSLEQRDLEKVYELLINSSYSLNEDTAQTCLALAALGLEQQSSSSIASASYKFIASEKQFDLVQMIMKEERGKEQPMKIASQIDVNRVIDILLINKNKRGIRVMAALIIKGCYSSEVHTKSILNALMNKITHISQYGVNSEEALAVICYIVNENSILSSKTGKSPINDEQLKYISDSIYKLICTANTQIIAHPNLDIYSTLQKLMPSANIEDAKADAKFQILFKDKKPLAEMEQQASLFDRIIQESKQRRTIQNLYILEIEACTKCYEQKSQPYSLHKLAELKSEAKYTDSCILVKFTSTQVLKQIIFNISEMKGTRAIKLINLYSNNKQGMDLAEMRNNWTHWRRVQQVNVDIGKKSVDIDFVLPVYATNILIEFQTVTLSKPVNFKQGQPSILQKEDKVRYIEGVDNVLQLLPSRITQHFTAEHNENVPEIAGGSVMEKESLACPRCGKGVQAKNGICPSCGENALQCTFCRNINYEKLDAFLCNECGQSRYVKFDLHFMCKPGFATEKIENESMKMTALTQIDSHLQIAQSNYQNLMKKRQVVQEQVKQLNESAENASAKQLQETYLDGCYIYYTAMMKSLNVIKTLKQEIHYFTQNTNTSDAQSQQRLRAFSIDDNQDIGQSNQCFSCTQEVLKSSLSYLDMTSQAMLSLYKKGSLLDTLYSQNLKMYTSSLQIPARKAIASIVLSSPEMVETFLDKLISEMFQKKHSIPAHLLSQNLVQESQLMIELLDKSRNMEAIKDKVEKYYWKTLFLSMEQNDENAAIAEQITGALLNRINQYLIVATDHNDSNIVLQRNHLFEIIEQSLSDSNEIKLFSDEYKSIQKKGNWLVQSLILKSSERVRDESKEIIQLLFEQKPELKDTLLNLVLNQIDKALSLESSQCDQYFDTLTTLLSSKEQSKKDKTEDDMQIQTGVQESAAYLESFSILFSKIDKELSKLILQEKEKESLGSDGFMPSISTGQSLQRLMNLISMMVKDSEKLKLILKNSVFLIIKSFLKIRKLNLTKNKIVQNCELEIEKMFKELHSEKIEEKEKFIIECIMIIESDSCDFQELRFLFEEICRVICPVKEDPVYLMNLNKAQSQEFYIRGKMSKNPYPSKSLGNTIGDVREKICKELELAEPELIELLVANKIVGTALSVKSVYEQIWWPYLCKQRNPDEYDVPNIEESDKSLLAPMQVTYRLAGIDGEATEDRVESLNEGVEDEGDSTSIEKKYAVTRSLSTPFESKQNKQQSVTGVQVLLHIVENLSNLNNQKYLAEWTFKLISYAIKIKENRVQFLKYKQTIGIFALRLFESVGIQSQIESSVGQKGQTLFDQILIILESLVIELNENQQEADEQMDVDQGNENKEAVYHVELFIQIMEEACAEMIQNHQQLDKTPKKIRALSKILPFLINKDDKSAIQIIVDFIFNSLNYQQLDSVLNSEWTNQEKFKTQFNIERSIEIVESIPLQKNFLKDEILSFSNGSNIQNICDYFSKVSMLKYEIESEVQKFKLANKCLIKFMQGLMKNHPSSQLRFHQSDILFYLYNLSQEKYKDRSLPILAQDIIESITNDANNNNEMTKSLLKNKIDASNQDKKKLAQKKKEEMLKMMQQKKNQNKFIKQVDTVQDEQGPKCITCHEGYSKKPTEILGMYVFTKKLKIAEMNSNGSGFISTIGYQTVTHANFIHMLCHNNAYRADSNMKQPKKEWEGAIIRNSHTKCNNLFPVAGGKVPDDSFKQTIDRYFTILQKTVGQCDNDKLKVQIHDFKSLLKKFSYEESLSRDTQGGGVKHNMSLIPFNMQMIYSLLSLNNHHFIPHSEQSKDNKFVYYQEQKIFEFLEQGVKLKQRFMKSLEEEKKQEEIEEEEKFSEDHSQLDEEATHQEDSEYANLINITFDQIAYYLTLALVFSPLPRWEQQKQKFMSIILFTLSSLKEDKLNQQPLNNQMVLTVCKDDDNIVMGDEESRKRSFSENKLHDIQRALIRLRPLLILIRIIDHLKCKWDGKRLGFVSTNYENIIQTEQYIAQIKEKILTKDNLQEVITDCEELFKDYKERMLKTGSVEEFLRDLGLIDQVINQYATVDNYIMSHF